MKHGILLLVGAASVLSLGLAYGIGRVHGRGARFDASLGSSEAGNEGRFWRFEVELATGTARMETPDPADALVGTSRRRAQDFERVPRAVAAPEPEAGPTLASSPPAAAARERAVKKSLVSGPLLEGWYANGQLHFRGYQVQARDGEWVREGAWEAWHENGTLHELGAYADDVEDGEWKWFYENGARMAEGRFAAGERVGAWLFWHDNGWQMMEGAYVDGERDGAWVFHHPSGVRAAAGSYDAGEATGDWSFWLEDGTVDPERTGSYVDGELER